MQNSDKSQVPLSTVGMLIYAPAAHQVLLVKSHKWNHLYTVPGGKVQLGESCLEAAIREVQEETALQVTNVHFAMLQEAIYSDQFWKKKHLIMHDFVGELLPSCDLQDVKLNDEAEEFIWVSPFEANQLNLAKETQALVQWFVINYFKHRGIT
jgi:8-oxo-dGTP pyrophosphatase MutT (NUDIX family)